MWTREEVLLAPDLIVQLWWEPKIASAAVSTAHLDNGWIPLLASKGIRSRWLNLGNARLGGNATPDQLCELIRAQETRNSDRRITLPSLNQSKGQQEKAGQQRRYKQAGSEFRDLPAWSNSLGLPIDQHVVIVAKQIRL